MTLTAWDARYLVALAREWAALVFVVPGYRGDPMGLLMPCPVAFPCERMN